MTCLLFPSKRFPHSSSQASGFSAKARTVTRSWTTARASKDIVSKVLPNCKVLGRMTVLCAIADHIPTASRHTKDKTDAFMTKGSASFLHVNNMEHHILGCAGSSHHVLLHSHGQARWRCLCQVSCHSLCGKSQPTSVRYPSSHHSHLPLSPHVRWIHKHTQQPKPSMHRDRSLRPHIRRI